MTDPRRFAITCALLCLSASAWAQSNLIINGGFESPIVPSGTFQAFPNIPGWTLTFGVGIEIQNNVAGAPFAGNQFAELDSFSNSGMQQVVPTSAGQIYTLRFMYSPRPNLPASSNGIEV